MNAAIAVVESNLEVIQNLALEFREFVASLHKPEVGNHSWAQMAQHRCLELSRKFAEVYDSISVRSQAAPGMLNEIQLCLERYSKELAQRYNRQQIREIQASLVRKYEDFVAQMRQSFSSQGVRLKFQSLRYPRVARSALHAALGLVCVLLYELLLSKSAALIVLISSLSFFVALEVSRRFSQRFNNFLVYRLFGAISRPQEQYKTNSATYYLLAITICTAFATKEAVCIALLVLAFGDPVASIVGSRWGKYRLFNDKSLVGSLAFWLASTVASALYLVSVGLPIVHCLAIAGSVAAVGAATELFSGRIDDNFTIPIACTLLCSLWLGFGP